MINRWQADVLKEELNVRRGVQLTGARQCGKSTLVEAIAGNSMRVLSLDDADLVAAAEQDAAGFVDRPDGKTLCIDEIQKAPFLLEAVKRRIDHDRSPGQYILTGSSNLRFAKRIGDSLAGRLGHIRLRTLALGEILGGRGDFFDRAFARDFTSPAVVLEKRDVIRFAFRGGYPEPMSFPERSRRRWYRDYLDDLLLKDVRDVTELRKLDALRTVSDWLLAHSSKFFDQNELCAKAGLAKETLGNYLSALKALYLFDEVPAWAGSDYAKVGKRSKWFVADPGLLANLTGRREEDVYWDADASGKLIESWVCHELAALADRSGDCRISQYRDGAKREIDFMVEREDGALLGVEVKAGSNVGIDAFKHLKWFAERWTKSPFTGIVLFSGKDILRFGEGFYAVPFGCLGS